ncbi:MAG: hypothetical protein IPM81_10420 [Saprospirales bacterium]|nr:hypothetical protein [Saprospirales bacterium]
MRQISSKSGCETGGRGGSDAWCCETEQACSAASNRRVQMKRARGACDDSVMLFDVKIDGLKGTGFFVRRVMGQDLQDFSGFTGFFFVG